jgi:NAD(P)H dehydrogenase (quinone)
MTKILVTGATGHIGRKTLEHLLKRKPASDLVGLARDPARAAELAAAGVEIRKADYFDYDALAGIDKLLLVSAHGFTDRHTQHQNVIHAAREVGVKHVLYTPIARRDGSDLVLPEITDSDLFTEKVLKESGLDYTILAHPPFMESFQGYIGVGQVSPAELRFPAGDGKVAPATRDDLAEAQAIVLAEDGHQNRTYVLTGSPAVSFNDVANTLSALSGTTVNYVPNTDEEFIAHLLTLGMAEHTAHFLLGWMHGIKAGEWVETSGDVQRLLGRKTTSVDQFLRARAASA